MQKCILCGNSYISDRGREYCSDKCRKKKWRLDNREKGLSQRRAYNHRRWERVKPIHSQRHCAFCQVVFMPNRRHPNQPYCSNKCRTAAYRRDNNETVNRWRRESYRRNSETKRKADELYKDEIRFAGNRKIALERDNNTCQNCGHSGEKMNMHHLDWSGQSEKPNHAVDNLQTLCGACHIRIHGHQAKKRNNLIQG